MMHDLSAILREHMRQHGLSQRDVADRAHVSQATVSRAMSGPTARLGRAKTKVFIYLQNTGPRAQEALDAVQQVWDGTPEHERALARLIAATADLWPRLGRE